MVNGAIDSHKIYLMIISKIPANVDTKKGFGSLRDSRSLRRFAQGAKTALSLCVLGASRGGQNLGVGQAVFLPAPGIVGSEEARRILLADQYVSEAVSLFDRLTVALVGIGSVEPSRLLARSGNVFSDAELALVQRAGAVGDLCLRFFNAAGEPVISELDQRVIGIPLEQLRRVQRTIGIAGSSRKHTAIRGALRGHWINVLITDRFTAHTLLDDPP